MKQYLIAASRHLARWFGSCNDETLSAYIGRLESEGRKVKPLRHFIDWLLLEPGHCKRAHERTRMSEQPTPEALRIVLAFTPNAVEMLLEGLAFLPINRAGSLHAAIREQVQQQMNPPQEDRQL